MNIVDKILDEIRFIPPLSSTTLELLQMVAIPDHTIMQVANVVSTDPLLAGQILKVANSAALARRIAVETIDDAVSYLGDKMVTGIALGASASQIYDAPLEGYEATSGALWTHCLNTAIASRRIAEHARSRLTGGVAYTAGLLHDIGKALLSIHLRDRAADLTDILLKPDCVDFLATEQRIIGTDHTQVGEILARHWKLPESLCSAIRFHHTPSEAPLEHRELVYLVHLGDIVSMMSGEGTGADSLQYPIDPKYVDFVDIDRQVLEKLLLQTWVEYSRSHEAMGDHGGTSAGTEEG